MSRVSKSRISKVSMSLVRLRSIAGVALLGFGLSACASSFKPAQKAFAPDEYDMRHPIKLADNERHLDVFASGRGLDRRQLEDIRAFVQEHAAHGSGPIMAAVPQGPGGHQAISVIRQALGGRVGLQVKPYAADSAMGAAPVRLSFHRLQAKVASQCGLWPEDLASGGSLDTWNNRPYHNFGCAYQTMIAAQVANPIDLVRPRAEGSIDVRKRIADIEALRKGDDPSTKWSKDDAKVKEAAQ
jgi:pilus assembly protein CpaD